MKTAVFTIIAKNYLAFARVLMASIRTWSPDVLRIVVLVDRPEGHFDPDKEDFDVILTDSLPIQHSKWFHFKYTIMEASTAVKPFAFEYILEHYDVDKVLYFDPDIATYRDIASLVKTLDEHSIILTPHLTASLSDGHRPSDLDILRAGSYNLGFIGTSRCSTTDQFLQWWKARLYDQCVVDLAKGLFVDQRWVDLVPGMFPDVGILRSPALNVAYWNLAHRTVTRSSRGYQVEGEPLCFFHFSGFNPDAPHGFSRHQNRFTLDDLGDARELVLDYRQRLLAAGFAECRKWPYAYGSFDNGFPIPDMGRPAHHEVPEIVSRIEDPFSDAGYEAFVNLWNEPLAGPDGRPSGVTRLAYRIYSSRSDVQQAMPDIFGGDLVRFLKWILSSGQTEHNLSSVFIAPITDAVRSRERRESSATITRNSDPIVHEKIIGALTASGIWVRSAEGPIQVDALNVLIGNGDAKLHLSKLARAIYESRSDLQRFFPDPCGRNSVRFLLWFLTYGANEYRLADVLVSPLRSQWDAVLQSLESPLQRLWYRMVLQAMAASLTYREKARRSLARFKLLRSDVTLRMPGAKTPGGNGGHTAPQSPVGPGSGLFGANIVGYVRSEMGVGESVRCAIRAARATSIPVAIRTVDARGPYRLEDHSVARIDKDFPYAVNLFHVNADQIDLVMARLGPEFTRGKYNIGYWAWESAVFPDRWQPAFQYLQEIWTPSAFCQSAIAQKSPLPVLRMPHAIELECDHSGNIRSDFSIPYGGFVFLAMVDLLSVAERKNPLGVLKTFRLAQSGLRDCHLVLKINHGDECPEQMTAIVAAAQGLPVTIIDRTIDRQEVNALLRACDCMVSLHRAEGFGLSIAEAMYLEKPVIVTGYSGNTDFTRPDNSFLVDYDLTRVPSGCPPYVEGTFWAEPNLDHAAKQMQLVREDQALRASRAKRAGQFVRAELSPAAVGRRMRDRLELILADQLDAESTSRLRD